jgi:UDP-N-acetylmuramoyl-tripeptide--D-alanyl-D-alanine ligase
VKLTLGQVADWIHADGEFDTSAEAVGYGIDSRTIGAGELFFAVRGERLDGHDYVQAALANGAIAAVVSNRWVVPAEVDDWGDGVGGEDYDEGGGCAGFGGAV